MSRFQERRTVAEIERDIASREDESAACPWCSWGCWCDGDWSPEAWLVSLREELAEAQERERRDR